MPYIATGRRQGKPSTRPLSQSPDHKPDNVQPVLPLGEVGTLAWSTLWDSCDYLREGDVLVLTMLCATLDEIADVRGKLASGEVEPTYRTTAGRVYAHPAIGQLRTAEAKVTAWCAMLGLSPSDRARLGIRDPNPLTTGRKTYGPRVVGVDLGPVIEVYDDDAPRKSLPPVLEYDPSTLDDEPELATTSPVAESR